MTTETPARRFRVALSFPGERRLFVEKVARSLALYLSQRRVLYDMWLELRAEFARDQLGLKLPPHYGDDSELVVVFVCDEYNEKAWCGLEWGHIYDHIYQGDVDRVMLVRLDSTTATLKGLTRTAGPMNVDTTQEPPALVVAAILDRLRVAPDEQLTLFLDRVLHDVEITSIVQQVLGDRSVAPTSGRDAIAALRERRRMCLDLFDQLRAQLKDESPANAPGIDLVAEIDAMQLRQKLDPVHRRPRPVAAPPRSAIGLDRAGGSRPPSHFSLVIDRTRQWLVFKEKCSQRRGNHVFVVHGKHDQDLHLFLERICRFFDDVDDGAGLVAHELVVIDLERGGIRPSSAAEWEAVVRQRIDETIGSSTTGLASAINELCRENAAILVFVGQGGGGLIASPRAGLSPLSVAEKGAFVDFVRALPTLLPRSRQRPLRVVIPVEYAERRTDPLWLGLDPLFDAHGFVRLDQLTYPDWSEVEGTLRTYMRRNFGRVDPRLVDLCEDTYNELSEDPTRRSFAALGEALTDVLAGYHTIPDPPPARGRR